MPNEPFVQLYHRENTFYLYDITYTLF